MVEGINEDRTFKYKTTISCEEIITYAYYLLNIGLAVFCLYSLKDIRSISMLISELSSMLGLILLIIGVLHFNNIVLIALLHKYFKP